MEEIPAVGNVRYGRVQNIREVSAAVNEIIRRLEAAPTVAPRKVCRMAIALGGRSLAGAPATASLKFPSECEITDAQVQRLVFEAMRDFMGDKNIEATVPRIFYVNKSAFRQPVGTFGESLRGEFTMISCGKETRQNLERLKFDTVEHENVLYIIRPLALAELALTADEKELGTALVDIGAETTTVAVYENGTLAFLCTIPMGSRLITTDITTGLGVTEDTAENMKVALSSRPDDVDKEVAEYAHARAGEIMANVLAQLEHAGFAPSQLNKMVLAGGGAKLADFEAAVKAQCKLPVRMAEMPSDISFRVAGKNNFLNIDIIALLAAAARRSSENFLATPAPEHPVQEIIPSIQDIEDDREIPEPAYEEPEEDEEEDEIEYTNRDNTIYTGGANAAHREAGRRVRELDNDDELFSDDEEEEDDMPQPRKSKGFGFFSFRKRREEPKHVRNNYEDDEYIAEDENDEYEEPEEPVKPRKQVDPNAAKRTISAIQEGLLKLFTPDEEDDQDE